MRKHSALFTLCFCSSFWIQLPRSHAFAAPSKLHDLLRRRLEAPSLSLLLHTGQRTEGFSNVSRTSLKESSSPEVVRFDESPSSSTYSLIWSRGFLPKFVGSLLILHAIHRLRDFISVPLFITRLGSGKILTSTGLLSDLILPILSSSCCLVQLIINVVVGASGCAGFNKWLGPLRPTLLSVFVYLNAIRRPESLPQLAWRTSLALLPELVFFWNSWRGGLWRARRQQHNGKVLSSNDTRNLTVEVEVPTMGCVACIQKIESSLRKKLPGGVLVDVSSRLYDEKENKGGGGQVMVTVAIDQSSNDEENDALQIEVVETIIGAGFQNARALTTK